MTKTYLILVVCLFLGGILPVNGQWKPWNDLPAHCAHVTVIKGEPQRHLAKGVMFENKITLVEPGPNVLAATKEALLRMTPMLCQSLRRIAFGHVPDEANKLGAVNSFGAGDMVMINLSGARFNEIEMQKRSSQLIFQGTLIHEAMHAAETLLGVESKDKGQSGYGGTWGPQARNLARMKIENSRLEMGFYNEWQRVHRNFIRYKWAKAYGSENALKNASANVVAEAGFMKDYGAANWAEDVATFVEQVYVGKEMADGIKGSGVSEDLRQDKACMAMQAYSEQSVPAKLSAVYAKLMFLLDLGLIKQEDAEVCTGRDLRLTGTATQGFSFYQDGELLRRFELNAKASMGRATAIRNVFEMSAEGHAEFGGKNYPATMKLRLDVGLGPIERTSWPRGAYELALVGQNTLTLRLDGAKAGDFNASEAYVLVTSSTNKLITGSIFLTKAWRPNAPIPVPQVFDPPLHIRFQMKK